MKPIISLHGRKWKVGGAIGFDAYETRNKGEFYSCNWKSNISEYPLVGSEGAYACQGLPDVNWPIHIDLQVKSGKKVKYASVTLIRRGRHFVCAN